MIQIVKLIVNTIYKLIRAIARKDTPTTIEAFDQSIDWSDLNIYKSVLIAISLLIMLTSFIMIIINSFKGISQIINGIFNIDDYRYIDILNIDLRSNLNKIYIPELIISIFGLLILVTFLYYLYQFNSFIPSIDKEDINVIESKESYEY